MKITHSKTVNIIKVTTSAHSDAPQPMNVSLERMSSSSGLHCHREKWERNLSHQRFENAVLQIVNSGGLYRKDVMNFIDSNKKKITFGSK